MSAEEMVVSTKERPGRFDGLESAKPGEPVFTLQGGDVFAETTILYWAGLARAAGLAADSADESHRLLVKASAAEEAAWTFRAYRLKEIATEGVRASYSKRAALMDPSDANVTRARVADKLYNIIAEAVTAGEAIEATGFDRVAIVNIETAVRLLREATDQIEPRRHLQRVKADAD